MSFLHDDVIITGAGGSLQIDAITWCGLLQLGAMPEPDQYGRPLPGEEWKVDFGRAAYDDEKLPVSLSGDRAKIIADTLELYSARIPEREEIGEVLNEVWKDDVDGLPMKYAVTSKKGWIETDDVELVFLEQGKQVIRDLIDLCRRGPIKVSLADDEEGTGEGASKPVRVAPSAAVKPRAIPDFPVTWGMLSPELQREGLALLRAAVKESFPEFEPAITDAMMTEAMSKFDLRLLVDTDCPEC